MSAVEVSVNFDDLMQAVRESSRGRWFLEQYESRLRQSDTSNILAAITKLETVIATTGPSSGDAALVARAKAAIAAARNEIASLHQGDTKLSEEARLFAKLAEMARSSFPSASTITAGVNRALKLVDELDQHFGGESQSTAAKQQFFAQDADVFEAPAKAEATPFKPIAPAPVSKDIERGAKLTIRKSPAILDTTPLAEHVPEHVVVAEVQPTEAEQAPEPATTTTVHSFSPPEPRQSRVVIIRRKPEELQELPLVSEMAEAPSAA